jgi:serine/threonine-protein kinase RsbW
MRQSFSRNLQQLEDIFGLIGTFCAQHGLDQDVRFMLDLVLEELFTNALKYNADNTNDIQIELQLKEDMLTIILTEYDVPSFDLNSQQVYDLNSTLEERPVGKLGIHFVKKMLDNVTHEYSNGKNKIILHKRLKEKNA